MTVPPYLKRGDTIAICCPAGYMAAEKVTNCITTLRQEGYHVIVGENIGSSSNNYFSGTDEERINELLPIFSPTITWYPSCLKVVIQLVTFSAAIYPAGQHIAIVSPLFKYGGTVIFYVFL